MFFLSHKLKSVENAALILTNIKLKEQNEFYLVFSSQY